jgi:hypothetical protein
MNAKINGIETHVPINPNINLNKIDPDLPKSKWLLKILTGLDIDSLKSKEFFDSVLLAKKVCWFILIRQA